MLTFKLVGWAKALWSIALELGGIFKNSTRTEYMRLGYEVVQICPVIDIKLLQGAYRVSAR